MSSSSACVVDASTLLATVFQEPISEPARVAISSSDNPIAPEVLHPELVSALSGKVRHNIRSLQDARDLLAAALAFPVKLVSSPRLHADAFELACRLNHPSYDCYYLALAIERDCRLVTIDRRLARAAQRAGLGEYVELLGEA